MPNWLGMGTDRAIRLLAAPLAALIISWNAAGALAEPPPVTVYKTPWCGCCSGWAKHMRANGFTVVTRDLEDLTAVKKMLGIPEPLQSCHTATVGDYVVEGHVPAKDVKRMLTERPKIRGITTPGMPVGSPGMEGGEPEPYEVLSFKRSGPVGVFSRH